MDPELKKLLDALKGYSDKGKVLAAIKDEAEYADLKNAIYQPAFNDGHGVATAAHTSAKSTWENKIRAAEEAKTAAENALEQLKKSNPDQATLHKQYTDQIAAKDSEIQTLKATHLAEKKDTKKAALRNGVEKALRDLRVDEHKAAAMADAFASQYVVNDDLSARIIQRGQSTAYAGDEKAQITAFAADLFKEVPKDLIRSQVPGGGSAREGQAAGDGDGSSDKRSALQRQKEAAQNKFKRPAIATTADGTALSHQEELHRRMGRTLRPSI
jgi:alanyl-tRNA synthetase